MDFEDPSEHGEPNHERWMISWADFITLMFAVFVVLFASAATNKNTAKQVSEAVMNALRSGSIRFTSRGKSPGPGSANETKGAAAGNHPQEQQAIVELLPSLKVLKEKFQDEIAKGQIEVHPEARGLVISLRQAAFFASGEAILNGDSYPTVDKIAAVVLGLPNRVTIEGHTDAVPIHNSRFASNWELSAARSIAMLNLLTSRDHIPPGRMAIAGYGDTAPVEPNDDPEGRAHNRRVDVVILNDLASDQTVHTAH